MTFPGAMPRISWAWADGSVFKTLVLRGEKTGYMVCCIPVDGEVDLKKAARAAGDKKVEMLPMKELLPVTGYVRGGCSPIGMKKRFPIYLDKSAGEYEKIAVSAGMRRRPGDPVPGGSGEVCGR